MREGLKGGQVLITDVTYNKDHSPGVVGLPTASREWRRQLAVVPCRDTKPACGRTKYRTTEYMKNGGKMPALPVIAVGLTRPAWAPSSSAAPGGHGTAESSTSGDVEQ